VLLHKTSAGDTSATLTSGALASFSGFFFEVAGSHAFDQFSANGVASQQFLALPSITPTAGAAVFAAIAYLSNGGYTQPNQPPSSPTWKLDWFQAGSGGASRGLMLLEYASAASASLILPPYLKFPAWNFYSGGGAGLAYATFSIL